jgi:hypothetical protein
VWGHLFIFVATLASIYIVYKEYSNHWRDYKITLLSAGSVWLLSQVIYALEFEILHSIPGILLVIANSILLISFLILIRIMKPDFFRYPYLIVFMPLILPVAYLMVLNSSIMQSLIFFSMHVATIAVFIILSIGYRERLKYYPKLPAASVILLCVAFISYWILEELHSFFQIFGAISLSAGMIFGIYTFSGVINEEPIYVQEYTE